MGILFQSPHCSFFSDDPPAIRGLPWWSITTPKACASRCSVHHFLSYCLPDYSLASATLADDWVCSRRTLCGHVFSHGLKCRCLDRRGHCGVNQGRTDRPRSTRV